MEGSLDGDGMAVVSTSLLNVVSNSVFREESFDLLLILCALEIEFLPCNLSSLKKSFSMNKNWSIQAVKERMKMVIVTK